MITRFSEVAATLRALLAKATPRPWFTGLAEQDRDENGNSHRAAFISPHEDDECDVIAYGIHGYNEVPDQSESDLELAAAAVNAVDPLLDRIEELESAIRKHRDQRGDDRCWLDDEELYRTLPEGFAPPARDSAVELKLCEQFIACRHNPATEYVSPQRRIEELELEVERLKDRIASSAAGDRTDRFGGQT